MDLRQLQAFLAVVDHGGFTAAARATHTVQSNISTHVARLERELNATLVDRSSGKPTQEGEAVLARARRIQSELSALEADVSSLQGSPRGTVRMGIIGTTARWITPLLVKRLHAVAPDIHLVIADGTTSSQTLRILEGDLDLGLLSLPINDAEIRTSALFDEDHIVVVPTSHPLASRTTPISLAELTEYELMLSSPGTTFRHEIDAAFRAQDLRPRAQFEIDGLRLLASLAFQGFGVAIVPATAAPEWIGGDWVIIRVEGLGRRTVGLATRRRAMLSVAAQTTANVVQHIINNEGPALTGIHLHHPQG